MVPSSASLLLCTVSLKDLLSFSFSLIANPPHPLFLTTFCMDNFVSLLTALSASSLEGTLIYLQIINAMIYYKAHIGYVTTPYRYVTTPYQSPACISLIEHHRYQSELNISYVALLLALTSSSASLLSSTFLQAMFW